MLRFARRCFAVAVLLVAGGAGAQTTFTTYVASGLSNPIGIMNAGDGSNRLFVIQQTGAARVVDSGGTLLATPYFTLGAGTQCRATPAGALATVGFTTNGERGLLGLAFHPNFESNGRVFVSFTDVNGDTYVAGFTVANPTTSNALTAGDLATCTALVRIDQDGPNHNGGNIVFGPDGFLYIGMGDGGGGNNANAGSNDACNRAQTLDPANLAEAPNNCALDTNFTGSGGNGNSRALLGKILRINVDASTPPSPTSQVCGGAVDGSANYAIPVGNPFAGADASNACDEVWAYGIRNPWRFSFDRQTGDLFIGDVGQTQTEEIDFQPAASFGGQNWGWNPCEGPFNRGSRTTLCTLGGATGPVIEYGHASGRCSVTGGYRYRGPVVDAREKYFYADYCTGEVWASTQTGATWSPPGTPFQDLTSTTPAFGEDELGNLYTFSGSVLLKLTGVTGPADGIFQNSFE